MSTQLMKQGLAVLAMMFLIGTSCSDNSGDKAKLAAAQASAQYQAQLAQSQLTIQKAQDKNACLVANPSAPHNCDTVGN